MKNTLTTLALSILLAGLTGCIPCASPEQNDTCAPNDKSIDVQNQSVIIYGKAATGMALNGTVMAINANGETSETVTVADNGSYSLKINKGAPYMLKAISNNLQGADDEPLALFSYAKKSGIANITSLTTQALFSASNQGNLKTVFDAWQYRTGLITPEQVAVASKNVLANLKSEFIKAGLTDDLDIFTASFKTNGTGLDKVLDNFKANYTCESSDACIATHHVAGQEFVWNYDADTNK